jgi:hypothetical protein
MFSPIAVCSHCSDEYDPVEYRSVPVDPDEPQFCSDTCEERYWAAVDAEEAYEQAGWSAPVF